MGEWIIGALINLFGSIAINFGTNLLKLGHNEVHFSALFVIVLHFYIIAFLFIFQFFVAHQNIYISVIHCWLNGRFLLSVVHFTVVSYWFILLTGETEHSFSSSHHVVMQRERHSLESDGANGKLPLKPIIHFHTWRVGKF
jgi:hypothetical protein